MTDETSPTPDETTPVDPEQTTPADRPGVPARDETVESESAPSARPEGSQDR